MNSALTQKVLASFTQINLGTDTTLCEGVVKLLDIYLPNASYQWQDNSSGHSLLVTKPGTYYASIDLNGCIKKDTIRIFYKDKPKFNLGNDTTLCQGNQLVLQPQVNGSSFRWQDGSTASSYTVKNSGTYSLVLTNECGSTTDAIAITNGNCQLYMPTAFTPNYDGLNDIFRVKDPGFIESFKMVIYNRWGQIIFQTTDPYKGWDGKYRGLDQPMGNYIWQINLVTKEGLHKTDKGSVILYR